MRPGSLAAALLALAAAACGSDPEPPPPPAIAWIDVPGMQCADGSPTGIGISPGPADAVLVYLSGGGACWSDTECNARLRRFGKAELDLGALLVGGTLLDRTLPGNPFATWTIVFVPYCTGDVHAGDSQRSYGAAGTWSHHGYRNLQAAVARMAAALPRPSQVVVAGSSAGGFGSLLAHDLVRAEWTAASGTSAALVDDSGPTLVGTAIPEAVRTAWWDSWGLTSTVGVHCPACEPGRDLSEIWPTLRAAHPDDRLALVSTTQDLTMRDYFGQPFGDFDAPYFAAALDELAARIEAMPGEAAVFRVGGDAATEHALLASASLATYSAGGTSLLAWLSAMASGDVSWTSRGP